MVAASTQKQYDQRIKILNDAGFTDFLKNPEKVLAFVNGQSEKFSTRKVYISAILSTIKDKTKTPIVYRDALKEFFNLQKDKEESNELTEGQKENEMSWNDILDVQKILADEEHKTLSTWRMYVVVSLYTLNDPTRANYGDMKVSSLRPSGTGNELVWGGPKPYFIFREYKTAKTYGDTIVRVNPALKSVIEGWFDFLGKTPEYILDVEYSNIVLSNYIREVFRRITGKAVGINLLRHARITHELAKPKTIKVKKELARNMMHSQSTQGTYQVIQ
jgi:hypothetical protein